MFTKVLWILYCLATLWYKVKQQIPTYMYIKKSNITCASRGWILSTVEIVTIDDIALLIFCFMTSSWQQQSKWDIMNKYKNVLIRNVWQKNKFLIPHFIIKIFNSFGGGNGMIQNQQDACKYSGWFLTTNINV